MTVVYYTSTYFLDISAEIINVLKKHVSLHVIIEITPSSKNATIAEVAQLPTDKKLVEPAEILSARSYQTLQPYLDGVASAHFVIHSHPSGVSYSTIQASTAVWNYVKKFKPEIIQFEGFTLRTMGMMPFLFYFQKAYFTMHDPVPHSGEGSWKISVPYFLFFNIPIKKSFLFYSNFARAQFIHNYGKPSAQKLLVKMAPFSYYKSLIAEESTAKDYILFFGRISPYKGVDILLKAMPQVLKEFPDEQLIIAGKTVEGYQVDSASQDSFPNNIKIIDKFIADDELVKLITNAKFIVCPYLDATQSGVLMTAFALNTPAIASSVGSFPEFITDCVNGLLIEPGNPKLLADKIKAALKNNFYQYMSANIASSNSVNAWEESVRPLLESYSAK